jgi:hypothetical protein
MRNRDQYEVVDRIAKATAKLARMAEDIGLESLVYILRMAEIEARQSIETAQIQPKDAVQMAATGVDFGDRDVVLAGLIS